jgi:hypothetical protein
VARRPRLGRYHAGQTSITPRPRAEENHPMSTHHRAPRLVEPLEDRFLLNGGGGPGDNGHGRGDDDGQGHGHGHFKITVAPQLTATADFNGDGKADLVSVDRIGVGNKFTLSPLIVRLGKGDGSFTPTTLKVTVGNPSAVLAGDFNGDKKQDVALVSVANNQTKVTILNGDGKGKFGSPVTQTVAGLPATNITAGDVNGDGFTDLVAFNDDFVYVALNDGAGKFVITPQPPEPPQDNPFPGGVPVAAGNILNDGRLALIGVDGDQIFFNRATASTGVYQQTVLPTFGSTIPLDGKRLVVADVNGDGKNDLVALGDGSVSVALADPTKVDTFAAWTTQSQGDIKADTTLVGDVDGDGKADLFNATDKNGFFKAKLVLIGNGDGTFHKLVNKGKGRDHDDDDDDQGEDDDD